MLRKSYDGVYWWDNILHEAWLYSRGKRNSWKSRNSVRRILPVANYPFRLLSLSVCFQNKFSMKSKIKQCQINMVEFSWGPILVPGNSYCLRIGGGGGASCHPLKFALGWHCSKFLVPEATLAYVSIWFVKDIVSKWLLSVFETNHVLWRWTPCFSYTHDVIELSHCQPQDRI